MAEGGVEAQTKPVGFREAFWFWVKLGFIFGRTGGPDRDHAPGAGGQQALGHRAAVSTDAQLLHAAAGAGGAAGRHLHRLEAARYAGRHRGRLLRHTLDLRFAPALALRSPTPTCPRSMASSTGCSRS